MLIPDKIQVLYMIGDVACDDELEIIFGYDTIEDYYQNMSIESLRWFIMYVADVDRIEPYWLWEVLGMEWLESDDGDRIEDQLYFHEDRCPSIAYVHNLYPTFAALAADFINAGGVFPSLPSEAEVDHYVDQLHDDIFGKDAS